MQVEDFRRMSEDELVSEVQKLKREQMNLRFQAAQGETGSTGRMRLARRDAARAMTVLGERRRATAAAQE